MGLFQAIGALFILIRDFLVGLAVNIFEWTRSLLVDHLVPFTLALLPDGIADFFAGIDVAAISDVVADLTWLFPFWGLVTIYGTAYTICAGIRVVRWVLAFIPTIGA